MRKTESVDQTNKPKVEEQKIVAALPVISEVPKQENVKPTVEEIP